MPNSPHDPIAILAAVRPELFTFARGWVRVNSDGVTSLERHDDGPHRMVVDLDTTVVAQEVLSRICRAQAGQNVGPRDQGVNGGSAVRPRSILAR